MSCLWCLSFHHDNNNDQKLSSRPTNFRALELNSSELILCLILAAVCVSNQPTRCQPGMRSGRAPLFWLPPTDDDDNDNNHRVAVGLIEIRTANSRQSGREPRAKLARLT